MLDRKYGVGINSRDLRGPHIMNITGVRLSKQSSHQPETDAGYEPVFPSKEPVHFRPLLVPLLCLFDKMHVHLRPNS